MSTIMEEKKDDRVRGGSDVAHVSTDVSADPVCKWSESDLCDVDRMCNCTPESPLSDLHCFIGVISDDMSLDDSSMWPCVVVAVVGSPDVDEGFAHVDTATGTSLGMLLVA